MNLRTALAGCSSSQLTRVAAAWTLTVEAGTLRRELVELLAERIIVGTADSTTWRELDEFERRVVGQLVRAGGRHETELLTRRLGRAVLGERSADESAKRVDRAVVNLVDRGLLFRVFDADEQRRGVYLILPDELLDAARQAIGSDGGRRSPEPVAPPARVARMHLAADLFILTSALRREDWGAASRGLAGRPGRTVGQILSRLRQIPADGPGDPGRRWRFLLWLGQRAGWISRGAWPTPDEDAVERLLADPGGLPALALAAGPVSGLDGQTAGVDRAGSRLRQADALQLLSELDEAGWRSSTEVVAWLADELGGTAESTRPFQADTVRRRLEDQLMRWLSGRWFWFGLVAWGGDGAGWSVVAPTDALRSLTTGRRTGSVPAPRPGRVTGRRQFVATLDGDLASLYRAERYLALVGGDLNERQYGLTPATFDRGVRLGGDRDEALTLFARLLDGPVPEEWQAALEQWSSGASRLTLSTALLLASDRAEVMEEALRVRAAREAVAESLTPTRALVDATQMANMLAELARAGLPVEIDPGLRVEPRDPGRSAALANGIAESAWVALEVLRRMAPEAIAEQRDLQSARSRLDAVLAASVIEALNHRAASIVAAIANRRRPRAGGSAP
ncbi:MAG TPA: hypothetical protein VFH48_15520 [Chloroflexota bacterium]|nr:hypothetical protein [Chloroflexota bacterium]